MIWNEIFSTNLELAQAIESGVIEETKESKWFMEKFRGQSLSPLGTEKLIEHYEPCSNSKGVL